MKYNAIISSIREKLRYLTSVKCDTTHYRLPSDHKSQFQCAFGWRFWPQKTLGGQGMRERKYAAHIPKDVFGHVSSTHIHTKYNTYIFISSESQDIFIYIFTYTYITNNALIFLKAYTQKILRVLFIQVGYIVNGIYCEY